MATQAHTFTAGSHSGSRLRRLARAVERAAADVPDVTSTGASVVVTFDNTANSVQITAGPYQSGVKYF